MSLVSKIAIAYTCGMMTKDNIRKKFIENMEPPTYPVYSWDKPTDLIKVEIGYVEWAGETIKDLQQQNADLGAVLYDAYSAIITLPTDAMGWTYDDDQKRSSIRDNLLRDMNAELHKVGSLGKEE